MHGFGYCVLADGELASACNSAFCAAVGRRWAWRPGSLTGGRDWHGRWLPPSFKEPAARAGASLGVLVGE